MKANDLETFIQTIRFPPGRYTRWFRQLLLHSGRLQGIKRVAAGRHLRALKPLIETSSTHLNADLSSVFYDVHVGLLRRHNQTYC